MLHSMFDQEYMLNQHILACLAQDENQSYSYREIKKYILGVDPVMRTQVDDSHITMALVMLHWDGVIWDVSPDGPNQEETWAIATRFPTEPEGITKTELNEAFIGQLGDRNW